MAVSTEFSDLCAPYNGVAEVSLRLHVAVSHLGWNLPSTNVRGTVVVIKFILPVWAFVRIAYP